jgi:hypothetical protein
MHLIAPSVSVSGSDLSGNGFDVLNLGFFIRSANYTKLTQSKPEQSHLVSIQPHATVKSGCGKRTVERAITMKFPRKFRTISKCYFKITFVIVLTGSSLITLADVSGIEHESVELGFFLYSENLQIAPMQSTVSMSSRLAELNGKATAWLGPATVEQTINVYLSRKICIFF